MTRSSVGRVQGDSKDTITLVVGGLEDLSTVNTCEAHVWKNSTKSTLDAEVLDPDARTVLVQLGEAPDGWLPSAPSTGGWNVELECTFLDGSIKTFPEDAPPVIKIREQGDPAP